MAGLVVAGLGNWQYEGTPAKKKHEHGISYLTGGGLLMEGLEARPTRRRSSGAGLLACLLGVVRHASRCYPIADSYNRQTAKPPLLYGHDSSGGAGFRVRTHPTPNCFDRRSKSAPWKWSQPVVACTWAFQSSARLGNRETAPLSLTLSARSLRSATARKPC